MEHRERKGLDLAYLNSAAPFEQDVRRKPFSGGLGEHSANVAPHALHKASSILLQRGPLIRTVRDRCRGRYLHAEIKTLSMSVAAASVVFLDLKARIGVPANP